MADTFLPTKLPDLADWYANFVLKIHAYAPALGLDDDDTDAVAADYAYLQYVILSANVFAAEARERTEYRDLFLNGLPSGATAPVPPAVPVIAPPVQPITPGIIPRARALARRIKAAPAYNDAIGRDLRLIGVTPVPPANPKPVLKAQATAASNVFLRYVKSGYGGVQIEGQRGSETAWTPLAVSTVSPYTDSRPPLVAGQPEVRRYRARFFVKDVAVGESSDVVTVTTVP